MPVSGLQYGGIDYEGRFIEVRRTVGRYKKGVQITSRKSNSQRRLAIPLRRLPGGRQRAATVAARALRISQSSPHATLTRPTRA